MRTKPIAVILIISWLLLTCSPASAAGRPAPTEKPAAPLAVGCSPTELIAAITAANLDPNPDILELTPNCAYTLTDGTYIDNQGPNGLPVITTPITINGHAAIIERSTAAGTPNFRIFQVDPGSALTLNNLTIQNGNVLDPDVMIDNYYGGGILNYGGTLALDNCLIANNVAAFNGGGIISFGPIDAVAVLTVTNSTFTDNVAVQEGGGIFSRDTLNVSGTTFVNNMAQQMGGGISNYDQAVVVNSTFFANTGGTAAGAIHNATIGTLTLVNSTLVGNVAPQGAGIQAGDATILQNTIVANNTGGNCALEGDSISDGGGNLNWGDAGASDCPGTEGDPNLTALKSFGGPTQTMIPLPGSAAIDAGVDAVCAAAPVHNRDQRGYFRPHGAHCDSGATEDNALPQTKFFLPLVRK